MVSPPSGAAWRNSVAGALSALLPDGLPVLIAGSLCLWGQVVKASGGCRNDRTGAIGCYGREIDTGFTANESSYSNSLTAGRCLVARIKSEVISLATMIPRTLPPFARFSSTHPI